MPNEIKKHSLPIIHNHELAEFFSESLQQNKSTEEIICDIAIKHNPFRNIECNRGLMSYNNSTFSSDILNIMHYLLDRPSEHPFKEVSSEVLSHLFTFDHNIQGALFYHSNMTPKYKLFYAAKKGDFDGVKKAINSGADFDVKDKGKTPLHWAAKNGHMDIVEYLIQQQGLDADEQDNEGKTPLHYAVLEDHEEIVNFLTPVHADVNMQDSKGNTPLHLTCSFFGRKYINTVKLLIGKGANIDTENYAGERPLHKAAYEGYKEIVECLVKEGADVNAKDNKGETSLHMAAKEGHQDIVKFLVANGAEVNAKNKFGKTPLDLAREKRYTTVANLLTNSTQVNDPQVVQQAGASKSM